MTEQLVVRLLNWLNWRRRDDVVVREGELFSRSLVRNKETQAGLGEKAASRKARCIVDRIQRKTF